MKVTNSVFFILLLLAGSLNSCTIEKETLGEPIKGLKGMWRVSNVTRNAEDITATVDSSGLRLTLNDDNSFTIENNNIPFVANANGTWLLDDPAYPFHISFKAKDSTTMNVADLSAPVVMGKRKMVITFSPGCYSNKYIYTLESTQ
jgi:hypothetical protein